MNYFDVVLPHCVHFPCKPQNSVLHINARSACNKTDHIVYFLSEFTSQFDIIMLTETWYNNDSNMLHLTDYNNYFINRPNKRGGGVAIYVKGCYKYNIVPEFSVITTDFEILTLKYNLAVLSVVYKPPNGNSSQFVQFFERFLEYVNKNNFRLICGGDFNINILEDCDVTNDFMSTIHSNGFTNLITTPTRVTTCTSSCLDLLITHIDTYVSQAGTIVSDVSDHCPVFMSYNLEMHDSNDRDEPFTMQYVSDEALESFMHDISAHDWSPLFNISDANIAYGEFIKAFEQIYATHFPLTTIKLSKKIRKPWITALLAKMIKNKNKLYHTFLRTRSPEVLKLFKKTRNKLNAELKRAKIAYYQRIFDDVGGKQPGVVWKVINDVLGRGKKNVAPEKIIHNGCELSGRALADHFNNHLTNANISISESSNGLTSANACVDTIFLNPVDEQEVFSTFMNLKNSKSLDINNMQIKPVKYVLPVIVPVLTHIFNLVFESGIFPNEMKKSRVTLIFKGGDKNNVNNYRPISVLPVFSKGLEKVIFFRISQFFDAKNILSDSQFGFRKGRSTETALLTIKEYILQNIEKNMFTLGLFIDFSKAFDCLNHDVLARKLHWCGIRGKPLYLLQSYLQNRSQSVYIKNHKSCLLPISNGVPQGSVLGPLLFNVYINDLVHIDSVAKFVIYADDSTILIPGSDSISITRKCNEILSKLQTWSRSHFLRINPLKTKVIIFRAKNKVVGLHESIKYAEQDIAIVNEHKILGVTFSSHLNWDTHVKNICSKLSLVAGVLSRCRQLLPVKAKLQVYYALFHSVVNYCSLVWLTTSKGNLEKVLKLQKKVLRYIANLDYLSPTHATFLQHNIIRAEYIYDFRILHSFYFSHCAFRYFLMNLSVLTSKVNALNTRSSEPWFLPKFRNNYKLQSLQHNLPFILNKYQGSSKFSKQELRTFFVCKE